MSTTTQRTEIAVIDTSVKDHQTLIETAKKQGMDLVLLGPDSGGMEELASRLKGREGIDALHIFSHGDVGQVTLGDSVLSTETLDQHATSLETVARSLSPEGDILLYGCRVGEGDAGRNFVTRLAEMTGADVAASDDVTGAADQGGDWILEIATGDVGVSPVTAKNYHNTLATTTQLDFSDIYNADVVYGEDNEGIFDNSTSLISASVATNNDNPEADGLPDDGVFTSTDTHPYFDLADFNSSGDNAWQESGTGQATVDLEDGQFNTIHVIASAGGSGPEKPAKFQIQTTYTDETSTTSNAFTVPDWFGDPPESPGYALHDGMDRWTSNGYKDANDPAIWGFAVAVDGSKTVDKVTINVTENQAGFFNFFGGAATTEISDAVDNYPPVFDNSSPTLHVAEDASATSINSLLSISDPNDNNTLTWSVSTNPSHGNLAGFQDTATSTGNSVTPNGLTYKPNSNFSGSDSFKIQVSDGNGGTDTATVNVTVQDAPEVNSITRSSPTGQDTNNDAVTYTVDFSESVSNIDTKDFTATQVSGNVSGSVSSVSSSSGTSVEVTVNSITGDGDLRLDVNDDDSITNGNDVPLGGVGTSDAGDGSYDSGATYAIDNTAPNVSDGNISLSGASGTGDAFKVGDTVTATWDDTGSGDNNSDTISGVTVDFSAFGGGAAVVATNSSDNWTATYTITEEGGGVIDATNRNVSVTATDDAGNVTTTADTTGATVDNDSPTVTDGNLAITTSGSGTDGAFITGDTVTLEWNNNADGNSDLVGATADFSAFGGGTVDMTDVYNDGSLYRASYEITAGTVDGKNLNASVSATDDAGNTTTMADASNLSVDNQAPTVTDENLSLSVGSGTGGTFIVGDTVTATWDNTGSGDNNGDISGVTIDFSAFGGGAAVAATNSSDTWAASYTIEEGNIDGSNKNVSVTATDDAGLTATTADTTNATVDNDSPGTPTATLAVDENSANETSVGSVSGGGPDGVSYSLTDDAGGRFAIDANTGAVTVANGSLLDHESHASHDITVRAIDDAGNTTDATLTVTVNDVNEAPTVDMNGSDGDGEGFSTSFSAGGDAVAIADADAILADEDAGDHIESLTVTLTGSPDGDGVESLSLDSTASTAATDNGLTLSYTASTGELSVSGTADASVYQTILRGVRYDNTDAATDINTGDRTITVVANDGAAASTTATSTVSVVTAPVVDLGGDGGSGNLSGSYTEGDGTTNIAAAATITEPDDENLNQLVISLTNAQDGAAETITLAGGSGARDGITVSYDSDTRITLSGAATAANYQTLLRELQYSNTADDPATTNRTITVQGRDVNGDSGSTVTQTLTINAVNDAPTGVPVITGDALVGGTLTADTSGIADPDGLGAFSYQWLRDGEAIDGATSKTYSPTQADLSQPISVQVSYTDTGGTSETLSTTRAVQVVAPDQGGDFSSHGHNISRDLTGPSDLTTADVDDDGDQDLIAASRPDNSITLYTNDGSGNFDQGQTLTTQAAQVAAVQVADLNGDGHLDVLSASVEDNKLAWYPGDGQGNFGSQQLIDDTSDGPRPWLPRISTATASWMWLQSHFTMIPWPGLQTMARGALAGR